MSAMRRSERLCCLVLGMIPMLCVSAAETAKRVKVTTSVDSENGGFEAHRVMDGDPDTMWHTEFSSTRPSSSPSHSFDLGPVTKWPVSPICPARTAATGRSASTSMSPTMPARISASPRQAPSGQAKNIGHLRRKLNGRYVTLRAFGNQRPALDFDRRVGQFWSTE